MGLAVLLGLQATKPLLLGHLQEEVLLVLQLGLLDGLLLSALLLITPLVCVALLLQHDLLTVGFLSPPCSQLHLRHVDPAAVPHRQLIALLLLGSHLLVLLHLAQLPLVALPPLLHDDVLVPVPLFRKGQLAVLGILLF